MSGMLASDSKAPDETPQQAPDGGAQGKPAAGGPGTVTRAATPEASKAAKAVKPTVDAAGCIDPAAAAGVAALASGVAPAAELAAGVAALATGVAPAVGVAPAAGLATGVAPAAAGPVSGVAVGPAAGALPGTPALPANGPVVAAQVKDGGVAGTAPATTGADTPAGPGLVGMPAESIQIAAVGTAVGAAPGNTVRLAAGNAPAAPQPPGTPGQTSGQGPAQPSPLAAGPLAAGSPAQPLSGVLEPGTTATAARTGESGTAVVPPVGKSATQQDPQRNSARILGQDTETAAGPGLPAPIQAGAPAVVPPAPTLQDVASPAAPGTAMPAFDAEPARLLPQVSGPLFSLASAAPGSHVMTLKLSPEDLGPLTVRAHIEGAAVRIELFAPGEAGREAVRGILPELRRGLGESGFGASLDLSEHNAPPDAWAGAPDPGGSGARDRRPAESPAFPRGSDGEAVRLPRTAVVLPRSITSSLDILV